MACELGYSNKAFRYFMTTARLDLEDQHHNTQDGLHLANMAGTWMVMVNGYAGVRVIDGYLSFNLKLINTGTPIRSGSHMRAACSM